jgi:hypothetical protein
MNNKTVDMTPFGCVLLVGLSDGQATACTRAVMPLPTVRTALMRAHDEIVQRQPLVIVARHDFPSADLAMLGEIVTVCAAELVTIGTESPGDLSRILLDALRAAEKRRIAK